jgi:hypothetical protein
MKHHLHLQSYLWEDNFQPFNAFSWQSFHQRNMVFISRALKLSGHEADSFQSFNPFFTRVCSPGKTSFSTPETPSSSLELVSFQSHGRQLPILQCKNTPQNR